MRNSTLVYSLTCCSRVLLVCGALRVRAWLAPDNFAPEMWPENTVAVRLPRRPSVGKFYASTAAGPTIAGFGRHEGAQASAAFLSRLLLEMWQRAGGLPHLTAKIRPFIVSNPSTKAGNSPGVRISQELQNLSDPAGLDGQALRRTARSRKG